MWTDLSDDELAARIENRIRFDEDDHIAAGVAREMVADRDDQFTAEKITKLLDD